MKSVIRWTPLQLILCAVLAFLCFVSAAADDADNAVAKAIEQTRNDIEQLTSALNDMRTKTSAERTQLARAVSILSAEVQEKREARRRKTRLRDQSDIRIRDLEEKAASLEQQVSIVRALLVETRRSTEALFHIADAAFAASELAELDDMLQAAQISDDTLPAAAGRLLALVSSHTTRASLIRRSPGAAIASDGRECSGTFVQIGAVQALFSPEDPDGPTGIVRVEHGSSRPHVWTLKGRSDRASITAAAAGNEAAVPLDLTSGAVFRTAGPGRSLTEQIRAGGVVMIPIIAIAFVCLVIGVWKLVQLMHIDTDFDAPLSALMDMLRRGQTNEAATLAEATPPPLRRLMEEGVRHINDSKDQLEEIMHEAIIVEAPPLEKHLSILAVGAAVSPLLGLLGTVTGMIHTFSMIAVHGTSNPRLLSGGISEALITTEAGLIVAIPLLLLHAFLSRRVRTITDGLEMSAISFINTLKTRSPSND